MARYTKGQEKALRYAFKKGGALRAPGSRMGAAFRRCCERLVLQGLLHEDPPFVITAQGLEVLREIYDERHRRRACIAYSDDLKEVEAAIACRGASCA